MNTLNKTLLIVITASSLSTLSAYAEELAVQQEKKFSIGVGTYSLLLDNNTSGFKDDEFYGAALSAGYAFTDNIAVKGAYYSLEHDDFKKLEVKGFDLAVVAGTGLATEGFKIYGGAGLFSEKWEVKGFSGSEKFSGAQLVGGLGYNWEYVSLDLSVGIRDNSDYEDFINDALGINTDIVAVSAALTLSARF